MKKLLYSIVVFFLLGNLSAQSIEKQWVFNYIHSEQGTSLFEIDPSTDTFTLDNGAFEYSLAAKNNLKEICTFIGADSVSFLTVDGLYKAMGHKNGRDPKAPAYTDHCFTGDYPTKLTDKMSKDEIRQLSLLSELNKE